MAVGTARYTPQTWNNGQSGGTPVDAARLSYIESGILNSYASTFLNVLDYGADNTGTNSTQGTINAALAAGQNVYIPPGTYLVSGSISIPADTHLIIDGVIESTQASGTIFSAASAAHTSILEGNGYVYVGGGGTPASVAHFTAPISGTNNWQIRGLTFGPGAGILIQASAFIVQNCKFESHNAAIIASGNAQFVTVANCFANAGAGTDFSFTSVVALVCANNMSTNATTDGFDFFSCAQSTITGNMATAAGAYGYQFGTTGGSNNSIGSTITGNYAYSCTTGGFTGTLANNDPTAIVANVAASSGATTISVSGTTVKASNIGL